MNINLKPIYTLIKSRIDELLFQNILGGTIAIGIQKYYQSKADLSGNGKIDYAEILVDALGTSIFSNKEFVQLFIMQCISDDNVNKIADLLRVNNSISTFQKRKKICEKSKSAIRTAIINNFHLDPDFFKEPSPTKTFSTELVTPYTPLPIDEENYKDLIPKEFLSLHDYQKRIKDRAIQKLLFDEPNSKMLIHMPTGSGKTKTSIEAIIDFVRVKLRVMDGGGTVVWFAHSKELCEQAYNTFMTIWRFKGDFPIDLYKIFGDTDYDEIATCVDKKVSIIFIGFQKFNSLLSDNDSKSAQLKYFLHTNTKLAVVDEAHKSLAATYEKAIDFVTGMPDCRLIGLTATPGRSNFVEGDNANENLAAYFGNNKIRITNSEGELKKNPLKFLQEEKVLAKIKSIELESTIDFTQNYNFNQLSSIANKEDLGKKEMDLIATDPHRNAQIIEKIKEHFLLNNSILVFACSKDHCVILQRILKSEEIESVVILGETNKYIRGQSIKDFKNNKLKVIINFGVLSTGFDAPNLNTLLIARPTKSVVLYSQMVGRALRGPRNGGNEENTLITIKDNLVGFPDPDFMFSYWEEFWN